MLYFMFFSLLGSVKFSALCFVYRLLYFMLRFDACWVLLHCSLSFIFALFNVMLWSVALLHALRHALLYTLLYFLLCSAWYFASYFASCSTSYFALRFTSYLCLFHVLHHIPLCLMLCFMLCSSSFFMLCFACIIHSLLIFTLRFGASFALLHCLAAQLHALLASSCFIFCSVSCFALLEPWLGSSCSTLCFALFNA